MDKKMKYSLVLPRVKQVNKDGSIRFRLTSKRVDRDGEVLIPDGIILDNFKNNPIVLFGHGYQTKVPIGKIDIDSFKITSTYVDANVIFDEEGKDPFAEMIADKVRNGFLNAGSVGFRPTVISNDPVLPKQTGVTILKWELFEFTVAPIPSNVDSLAKREFAEFKLMCKSLAPDLDDSIFDFAFKTESIPGTINNGSLDLIEEAKKLIEKSGRVLSSKNRTLVKKVADNMRDLLSELDTLLAATEPKAFAIIDSNFNLKQETDNTVQESIEEQNRKNDVLIKNALESIEIARLINNVNDLKRIVS